MDSKRDGQDSRVPSRGPPDVYLKIIISPDVRNSLITPLVVFPLQLASPPVNAPSTLRIVVSFAVRFIPASWIAKIRPNLPTEVAVLASRRDTICHSDPGNSFNIDPNKEIRLQVDIHKRNKWKQHLRFYKLSSGCDQALNHIQIIVKPDETRWPRRNFIW